MKKLLLASSALVASAGVASADVSLSGSAEMGLVGGTSTDAQFHQDVDVTFSMSGTTDGGLEFGTAVDLDEDAGSVGTDDAGVAAFISGAFGTLTLGDTDGGFDWAMSEVPGGSGSLADDETEHDGYNSNSGLDGTHDGQIARYDHAFGDFAFALSAEVDDGDVKDPIVGIGVKYSADMGGNTLGFGVGYQTGETAAGNEASVVGVSVSYAIDALSVGLNYSVQEQDDWTEDQTHMGIGVSYSMDALTFGANYGVFDNVGGNDGDEKTGFGLSAGYDLGGGASILAGYGSSDPVSGSDTDSWSLGLAMSF